MAVASNPISVAINIPALRVEARTPSPSSKLPRSGAIVLDVHGIQVSPGRVPRPNRDGVHFTNLRDHPQVDSIPENVLCSVSIKELVVAHCSRGSRKASIIIAVTESYPDETAHDTGAGGQFGISSFHHSLRAGPFMKPQVLLTRSRRARSSLVNSYATTLAVIINIPNIFVELMKNEVDGLQLWADDVSKLLEISSPAPLSTPTTTRTNTEDANLIGSRFFSKPRMLSPTGSRHDNEISEVVTKLSAAKGKLLDYCVLGTTNGREVLIRILVPHQLETPLTMRPLEVSASDVDVLVEIKPDGRVFLITHCP